MTLDVLMLQVHIIMRGATVAAVLLGLLAVVSAGGCVSRADEVLTQPHTAFVKMILVLYA